MGAVCCRAEVVYWFASRQGGAFAVVPDSRQPQSGSSQDNRHRHDQRSRDEDKGKASDGQGKGKTGQHCAGPPEGRVIRKTISHYHHWKY